MTNTDPERDPMRALAKALFSKDEPPDPAPPDPAAANHVPGEGNNPTSQAHGLQDLVKALFYPEPPDA